jgi:hypothetical protein
MTLHKHDPDTVVARILARFKTKKATGKAGMARATIVVDENVSSLMSALREANFRVITPSKGLDDHEIKKNILAHRMLVTNNTKDFLDDAPVLDYGIIGLEALGFIDSASNYKDNKIAQMISKAVSEFDLISERSGYVLMLKPNSQHVFKRLG